jgi:hypothetical protein
MRKFKLILAIVLLSLSGLHAREGMWVPLLLEKYNLEEMQQMGFKLTASDIYDVNNASMKDAVVLFGGGCTGELISGEGLLITNHHCGYRQIQMHSSVENDYLTHGFWAKSREEELPNAGLSVSFLERMEDVTSKVFVGTENVQDPGEQQKLINKNISELEKSAQADGKFRASVRPFFYGNQYFLHVYKVYTDVRLVGAPPSSIGKFGGDTDNWMWPRHTGDFSLFRIYANKDNEPASYSKDNVPYKPKKFFPISLKGVDPEDFTMVFGYPGRTTQYLTSDAVKLIREQRNPDRIAIRDTKLDIMGRHMAGDPKVRIQYASKHAGVSNAWKKWQGENLGIDRLSAIDKKREFERDFKAWAENQGRWENEFSPLLEKFQELYEQYAPLAKASDYYAEIAWSGVELFTLSSYLQVLLRQANDKGEIPENARLSVKRMVEGFYKDYHQPVDEELFVSLLPALGKLPASFQPTELATVISKNSTPEQLLKLYRKSMLADPAKVYSLIDSGSVKKMKALSKDPVFALFVALRSFYDTQVNPSLRVIEDDIETRMKPYMAGIMEMKEGQMFYPDANSTLRVAYGRVEGYQPNDGVVFKHYTTLEGIMEKDNPEIYDYDVPARLKELFHTKDYGTYSDNGELPVCFVASNHTTGGNSGSPVINGEGHLIGINFDRCWEGTMSDIMFDPEQCRNIALDMRYALFIIDKFAGAGYLLNEMELIR